MTFNQRVKTCTEIAKYLNELNKTHNIEDEEEVMFEPETTFVVEASENRSLTFYSLYDGVRWGYHHEERSGVYKHTKDDDAYYTNELDNIVQNINRWNAYPRGTKVEINVNHLVEKTK